MFSDPVAIRAKNLSKRFHIYDRPEDRLKQSIFPRVQRLLRRPLRSYYRDFWALKDISIEIKKGESVGIVGRNGAGKSTLLQLVCGTLSPTSGSVESVGRVAALLELGSGFNPDFSGRENIYLNGALLGLTKSEINERFSDIASFADIGQFIEQPIRTYSSGMTLRLAFAVAVHATPQILIVDEALAVGDAAFQRKCIRKIQELVASGATLMFVSHDTDTVRKLCRRALYLKEGQACHFGDAQSVCLEYERDLFGASSRGPKVDASSGSPLASEGNERARMDPDLVSNCEKAYGDGRAVIENISVRNAAGEQVNVVYVGEEVDIGYRVRFIARASRPVFGMMLTTREGIAVFGTNTTDWDASERIYQTGDEVMVSFRIRNHLNAGVFYLTCGVHAHDTGSGLVYLHRRVDALLIRSTLLENVVVGGIAFLYPAIKVEVDVGSAQKAGSSHQGEATREPLIGIDR